ncbi:MAG: Asp23/Gls24 family envelope stress response protein [Candidatus Omnitrophica bacterium]|nr:Asp23/Gls24 family envelope stress response protein [Candidatus Omnitrophota bacterium]
MHKEEAQTELGAVRIYKDVIASIVSLAVAEIEGVKRIGGDFRSGILELIGKKSFNAIRVEFDKNNEVRVQIPLIVKYNFNVVEVANKVQENVRSAIERMTNLFVKNIDVNVQAIEA